MEKAKHYALQILKENDQIKSAEKMHLYQDMCCELVNKVSDSQKTFKVAFAQPKRLKNHPNNF